PYLIPSTDVFVHLTFHPAPAPDPEAVDCGAGYGAAVPEEPAPPAVPAPPAAPAPPVAPGQGGPGWIEDFHPVRFENEDLARVFAKDPHIRSPAILQHIRDGEILGFYVVREGRVKTLHLPPHEEGDRFAMSRCRGNVEILFFDRDDAHGYFEGSRLAPAPGDYLWGRAGSLRVSLIDRSLRASSAEVADVSEVIQSSELVESPGPGAESGVGESGACDPEREVCVLGIAGPPARGGAIPLNAVALDLLKYPDVDVAAPATKTKNLIVLVPPATAGIASVTVGTRRGSGTAGSRYSLGADQMLVVGEGETLEFIRSRIR
ncbi:hypothetical protein LQL77_29545, partial [Rhodococcus cerastii]|nr:hypothetical protein [Rhodococcus cerastii]